MNSISEKEFKKAKERSLYLLEYRDHSRKELIDKVKKTNSEEAAILAADKMEELGLLNDEIYAKKYADYLVNTKYLFGSRLQFEMRKKGLEPIIIEQTIEDLNIDPIFQINSLISKKYSKSLLDQKGKNKVVSALQRLGYRWDDIKIAINDYLSDEELTYE